MRRKNRARALLDEHEMFMRAATQNQIEAHRWENEMRTRPLRQLVAARKCWKRTTAAGYTATKSDPQAGSRTRSSERVCFSRVNRCEKNILRENHSAYTHGRMNRGIHENRAGCGSGKIQIRVEGKQASVSHTRATRTQAEGNNEPRERTETETESSPVVGTGGAHSSPTLTRDMNRTKGTRRHGGENLRQKAETELREAAGKPRLTAGSRCK
jgi:hypothetical protein